MGQKNTRLHIEFIFLGLYDYADTSRTIGTEIRRENFARLRNDCKRAYISSFADCYKNGNYGFQINFTF